MAPDLRLQHKLSQQLVMTPQLQQAVKLLQLSHLEVAQALQHELAQNPVLEELATDAPATVQAAAADMRIAGPTGNEATAAADTSFAPPGELAGEVAGPNDSAEAQAESNAVLLRAELALEGYARPNAGSSQGVPAAVYENTHAQATTLAEHLRWQAQMAQLPPQQRAAALYLAEEVDDDGYLPADAVAGCQQALGVSDAQVQAALTTLQDFDPVGVGARDLRECLLLQARQLQPVNALMLAILGGHLKDVEGRHYARIARALKVRSEDVQQAVRAIAQLDPRPGRAFVAATPHYIVPDLFVIAHPEKEGEFFVAANAEGLPRLGISSYYAEADAAKFTGKAYSYVQEKLRAASWLLRSVHMRQRTMMRVMRSIVHFQRDFFLQGEASALKPLVLRDVAMELNMHESTISRVTSNKYVDTPHGTFELKFFFNSTIRGMQGDVVASESVRQKIMRFIAAENKNEPLSDQKIVDLLRGHDISIARRTVAKYRKMLNKQPSSVRRREF